MFFSLYDNNEIAELILGDSYKALFMCHDT